MAGDSASQELDAVLLALGWCGRYQLFQLFQIMLCTFPLGFHVLSIVFIGKENEHKCRELNESNTLPSQVTNISYGSCSVTYVYNQSASDTLPCPNGLVFSEPEDHSMKSQWQLVCENEGLSDASQTILMLGMCFGALFFTSLADKFGRKPFHIFCHVTLLGIAVAIAFVPTYAAFMPLRFLLGACQQGVGLTSGILSLEILPAQHRASQSVAASFIWSCAMMILVAIAYAMRNLPWRYFQLFIAATSAYCIIQYWFTDESVRWLLANGKTNEAERILIKAAAFNRVDKENILRIFRSRVLKTLSAVQLNENQLPLQPDEDNFAIEPDVDRDKVTSLNNDAKLNHPLPKYNVLDFFRNRYVFLSAVINGYIWMVNAMTYYGLAMMSTSLVSNMYLGFLLNAAVEVPMTVLYALMIDRSGRKLCCIIFHLIAGLSLLASVTLSSLENDSEAIRISVIILSLIGKFCISLTFAVIWLYTPEQFPTNLRNASLGLGSMAGRIGGMIAPFSRTLGRQYPWVPGTIFGVCCLLVPILMRLLPETSGIELPQTLEEMTLLYQTRNVVKTNGSQPEKSLKNMDKALVI